jgi:hypothetical protein
VRHFFGLCEGAPERRLAVDRLAGMQRRQNQIAVRGHLDGDCYKINEVIADHREGIRKPAISTESLRRFPCAPLVAGCHTRKLHAG